VVYTGNWLSGSPENIDGGLYGDYAGVAIECQGFPDAPNKPHFPSALLRKGEEYNHTIVYGFDTF
jgi:aldose 1-epimerase